tara:strand:- start:91 stop:1827 length:1737 start_codon:yes stop_codon:yes gene_type:complete
MRKILLSIIISLLWSLPVSAYVIDDKVYLNACGSNPQQYKTDPLNVNNIIIEVPNKIISLEKSKYDRPFQTLATSSLRFNDKNYQISVSNFRDLIIKNERDEIIVKRKISGASSIYEFKHKDKVVAWGVGWNKYCGEGGYEDLIDFSVLRIFVPYLKNNKVEIQQQVLAINTSKTYSSLKPSDNFVISAASKLWGYRNEGFYRDHEFYELTESDGLQFIIQFENLIEKVDISKLNPHETAIILAKYRQRTALEKFTKNNFEKIHNDLISRFNLVEEIAEDIAKLRKTCFSGKSFSSISEIAENCYILPDWITEVPIIFQRWLFHYARLENPNKLLLGKNKSDLEDIISLVVPDIKIDLWDEGEKISLKQEVLASITHPVNFRLKMIDDDWMSSMQGCMYQFCSQKVFILFDLDVYGLIRREDINGKEDWVFFSRYSDSYSDLPKKFFDEVLVWQKEASSYENQIKTPNRIRFINGNNEIEDIQNLNPDTLGKPWIGIMVQNDNLGVLIPSVYKGSPAEISGLINKDIIIAIDNEEVKNTDDLDRIKFRYKIGDEITIKIMRNNKVVEKKLVLGDIPRD